MPRQFQQTTRNTFNKGLLTEFSPLNFPNEASIDELNCTLFKAGNRTKRLGVEYEFGSELSTNTYAEGSLFGTGVWSNVGEDSSVEFLVVQAGSKVIFYQKNSQALSSSPVPVSDTDSSVYEVDLSTFEKDGGSSSSSHIEVASINGRLVVVSPQINPFYIERDAADNSFTEVQIDFKVRDFKYLTPRLELIEEDPTPDTERTYDTQNTGWVGSNGSAALGFYQGVRSAYPPLTHPWYTGKDASGNFVTADWRKIYSGTTLIVNGHFVLDLFNKDRGAASGLALDPEITTERFNSVASFAGRVFFGGVGSRIYFSRLLEDFSDIGNLYQINDPTSEVISDLLDTDGGFISIPEANGIKKLHVFGSSLIVFADNGVWRVSGVDGVFRATEFSVFKVTNDGLAQRKSFVAGQNAVPFWWSYTGIHTIQVTDDGGLVEVNISRDTIQTFWNEISGDKKAFVQAEYDGKNDVVYWMYPNEDETIDYKLNRMLLLDVTLGAFYPWTVSDKSPNNNQIVGAGFFNSAGSEPITFNVVRSNGDQVIDSAGNEVVVDLEAGTISSSEVKFLTRTSTGALTFSTFTDLGFLDWNASDYSSYAEAAYNFMGDLGRKKTSPYITVFMDVTETGWEATGNGYTPVRNSSLLVSTYWDFRNIPSSAQQEAYRFKYPFVVDTGDLDTFTYPTDVISTRLKTRGRGKVMRIRFEGSQGKDFNLLGWETLGAGNTNY